MRIRIPTQNKRLLEQLFLMTKRSVLTVILYSDRNSTLVVDSPKHLTILDCLHSHFTWKRPVKSIDEVRKYINDNSWIDPAIKELEKDFEKLEQQTKQAVAKLNSDDHIKDMDKVLDPLIEELKTTYSIANNKISSESVFVDSSEVVKISAELQKLREENDKLKKQLESKGE